MAEGKIGPVARGGAGWQEAGEGGGGGGVGLGFPQWPLMISSHVKGKPPRGGGNLRITRGDVRKRTTSYSRSLKDICEHAFRMCTRAVYRRTYGTNQARRRFAARGDERRITSVSLHLSAKATWT